MVNTSAFYKSLIGQGFLLAVGFLRRSMELPKVHFVNCDCTVWQNPHFLYLHIYHRPALINSGFPPYRMRTQLQFSLVSAFFVTSQIPACTELVFLVVWEWVMQEGQHRKHNKLSPRAYQELMKVPRHHNLQKKKKNRKARS